MGGRGSYSSGGKNSVSNLTNYGGAHGEYKVTFQTPKEWKTTRKRG